MMSETSYRRLSPEDQALIDQASRESAEYEKELWQRRENSSREKAEKGGVEIIKLSDKEKIRFRKAMEPLYRKYCGDYMDLLTEVVSAGM
jgi:TRAP-type C4-dicarboxylate transport system substrate-binding protein